MVRPTHLVSGRFYVQSVERGGREGRENGKRFVDETLTGGTDCGLAKNLLLPSPPNQQDDNVFYGCRYVSIYIRIGGEEAEGGRPN